MAVNFQNVSFPIMGGVDTKISGLVLPAPKLQSAINVHADLTGSLQRRYGRLALTNTVNQSGTDASDWKALTTYRKNLLGFTSTKSYERSNTHARWVDKGRAPSYRLRSSEWFAGFPTREAPEGSMDSARSGDVTVYVAMCYAPEGSNHRSSVFVTVGTKDGTIDRDATRLYTAVGVTKEATSVRAITLGAYVYVFYRDLAAAAIKCLVINCTSGTTIDASFTTGVVSVATNVNITTPVFDVACNGASAAVWLVYNSTTASTIRSGFVSTAGVLSSTTTQATGGVVASLAGEVNATNTRFGMTWTRGTTPSDVYAAIHSWDGATWIGLVTTGTIETGTLVTGVLVNGCLWETASKFRVWYGGEAGGFGGDAKVYQSTVTTSAAVAVRVSTLRHATAVSQPFFGADLALYQWVYAGTLLSLTQPTHFLMRVDGTTSLPVAWANQGTAYCGFAAMSSQSSVDVSGTSYTVLLPALNRIVTVLDDFLGPGAQTLSRSLVVEMAHDQSHATIEVGSSLYLAGGFLQQYDGVSWVEANFLRFVNTAATDGSEVAVVFSNTLGGGLVSLAQYSYMIVPEWTNARGEREQGTCNGALSLTLLVAGDDTITMTIQTTPYTYKRSPRSPMLFAIYRTEPNPTSASLFKLVGTVANDPDVDSVVFVDTGADVSAKESLYLDGGVLENIAPPAGHILAQGGGRQFIAGFADEPNRIWASKLRGPNEPIMFSDAVTIDVPEAGGDIVALEVMNETLVIFKESRIYRVRADVGPNNTGTQGGFLNAELVPSDTGCGGARSVVITPMGLMFEGGRAMALLTQGFQVEDIGAPISKLPDAGTVRKSVLIPEAQHVRVLYDGETRVYDYYHRQWYVWTAGAGGPSCEWNGVLACVAGDLADIQYDSLTAWTDAGDTYALTVVLGWQKLPTTLQGDLRVRRVALTGESLAEHYLDIRVSHDYAAAISQTMSAVITAAGPLLGKWRLDRQVTSGVEITIRDAALNVYGADVIQSTAGLRLHEVTFELGTRGSGHSRG